MAIFFFKWCLYKHVLNRLPIVSFQRHFRYTGFTTFTEFWNRRNGLDNEDLDVFRYVLDSTHQPSVAIDIGANLGLVSFALVSTGFDQVYACEPVPDTFRKFTKNIRLNPSLEPNITPCQLAIGDSDRLVEFAYNEKTPGQSKISISKFSSQEGTTFSCQQNSLVTFFSKHRIESASFLKIDVEGFESTVLKGAMPLLKAGRVKYIYAEVIPHALSDAGSSIDEFSRLIDEAEFESIVPDSSNPSEFIVVPIQTAIGHAGDRRNVLFRNRLPNTR
jgi:FkbM family methyltransferase